MKLDATDLRYLSADEFRVLRAVETGSAHAEVVSSGTIASLSALRHAGINKIMGALAKRNLIAREQNIKYDGYRLTYGGYDFLALRALTQNENVIGVGTRVGVGKESDIYLAQTPHEGHEEAVLKMHRLGRISFRNVKEKRDYMGKRKSASWMYMSKLAAAREWVFMKCLHEHNFPVPVPLAHSRHTVLMSLIPAYPLRQIVVLPADQIPLLYGALMRLIVRLARAGLIHGDFNEYNLLIRELEPPDEEEEEEDHADGVEPLVVGDAEEVQQGKGFERVVLKQADEHAGAGEGQAAEEDSEEGEDDLDDEDERIHMRDGSVLEPVLIDFPQMVSVEHENAEYYFDRDVECVRRFFRKRFRFFSSEYPRFRDAVPADRAIQRAKRQRRREAIERGEAVEPLGDEDVESDAGVLELDVLTNASGLGGGKKGELELYMDRLQIGVQSGSQSDSDDDASDASDEEAEDEQDEGADADGIPSNADDGVSVAPSRVSKARLPSSGAAKKALADGDARGIAARIAAERERASRKSEKHHGRKAHAGKAGRTHAGGKAKSNAVRANEQF